MFFSRGSAVACLFFALGCHEEQEPPCALRSSSAPTVVDIGAAADVTVALLSDGRALCWGDDEIGTCGRISAVYQESPVYVQAADCLVAVAPADGRNSGGITADGQAVVWGVEGGAPTAGDGPQNGPGATDTYVLVDVAQPTQIDLTSAHGVAVTMRGDLYYWGSNAQWSIDRPEVYPAPAPVRMAVVEGNSACFLTIDGSVYCFGANRYGTLGLPRSDEFVFDPVLINLPAPALKVDMGFESACAHLDTGDVYCWGANDGGVLMVDDVEYSEVPVRIEGLPPTRELFMEAGGACVLDTSNRATCWGDAVPYEPVPATPQQWRQDLAFTRLAISSNKLCGLTLEGAVYCLGDGAGVPGAVEGFVDIEGAIANGK